MFVLTISQNGHDSANIQQCLCGQKGFGQTASSDNQSDKAKNQLIVATSICFIFMVRKLITNCIISKNGR